MRAQALEAERAAELAKQELMLLQRKDNLRSKYKNLRAMAAREVNQRRRLLTQEMRQETEDLGESSAPDASNITADAAPEKRKTRVAMADSVSTPDMAHMAVQCLIDVDEDHVKQRARMVDHFEHALAECRRENAALRCALPFTTHKHTQIEYKKPQHVFSARLVSPAGVND